MFFFCSLPLVSRLSGILRATGNSMYISSLVALGAVSLAGATNGEGTYTKV